MKALVLVLASLTLGGCDLYWNHSGGGGGGGGDDVCNEGGGGGGAAGIPAQQRDPDTGACVAVQTYPCPCGEVCNEPAMIVTGACDGPCENLDEADCLATAGCHAAYVEELTPGGGPITNFNACWDIEPVPVSDTGNCAADDAYSCSVADNCISVIENGEFTACQDEPAPTDPCGDILCQDGYSCGVSCDAAGDCSPACVATGKVGSCTGTVSCNSAPPSCEAGTTPGILDECYSGYCIPNDECTSGCSSYVDEADCLDNNCTATYEGSDCTCYSNGTCSCAIETFESCE